MAKTFMKDGKWIDAPRKTAVVVCPCGNKYIKTRPRQRECLQCISAKTRA